MSIDLTVGQQFGNYRLTTLLGRGGFAEVYLGEHGYLDRQAAIKIVHARLSQDEQENFYDEARTVAHLQHQHIVRVLEFGLKDGSIPYLVMEYAPNGTLRNRFPKGAPVPVEEMLSPFKQVAAALQYAHNESLVHRDIKPENMLLDAQNEVLLSDFGIALIVGGSRHQDVKDVAGTVAYMAPEQLLGHPTQASDQYSLGVVVYEWLTGVRLFEGSFAEVATQHIGKPPPSLRDRVPDIPAAVDRVVLKSLAKDPQQRFASVQDFADALDAAIQGQSSNVNGTESEFLIVVDGPMSDHRISSRTTEPLPQQTPPPFSSSPASKRAPDVARTLKLVLLALVLLLIAGVGLTYALIKSQSTDISREGQALYARTTSGAPQISDPLNAESTLSWLQVSPKGCKFKNGALHGLDASGAAICGTGFLYLRDFACQTEATILQGTNVGLVFRHELFFNPSGGLYKFTVTAQGNFELSTTIVKFANKHFTTSEEIKLIPARHSATIKTGLGQTNLLSVIARSSDLYLYINKQFVGHVKDSTSQAGSVDMFGTGVNGVDVTFRNMQIWIL